MATKGVHQISNEGYLKEGDLYESRIDYPEQLGHRIFEIIAASHHGNHHQPKKRVLEVAAGTGKLTRLLQKVGAQRGEEFDLFAIEPNAKLFAIFKTRFPHIPIAQESTEGLGNIDWLKSDPVDAIIIGQAYHWFASVRNLQLLASVMRPGAPLILAWSVEDQTVPWVARFKGIYEVFDFSIPSYRSRRWEQSFEAAASQIPNHPPPPFAFPCNQEWFSTTHPSSLHDLIARVKSKSYIAVLTEEEKLELEGFIRAFLENDQDWNSRFYKAVGKEAALIDVPFRTELFWTRRISEK